jgi:glycosyltransferase involved in cell wall biosynthesis
METRHLEDKAVSIRNAVATHERIIVEMTGAVERRTQEAIIVRGELDEALAEITAIKADRDAILAAHDLQVAAMEARHASERAEAVQKEAKTRHDETEFLYAALDAQRTKTNELASLLQIEKNATRVLAGQLEGARREVRRAEAEAENYGHTIATLQQRLAATDQTIALLQQQIEAAHRSPFWRLVSFSLSLRSFFSNTSRRNVPLVILRLYARLPISHDMRLRIRSVVNRIAPDILPAIDKIHRGQTEPTKAFVEKEPIHLADTLADPRHREASWRLVNDIHNHTAQHGPVTHIIALPFLATGGADATAINYCNAALSNAYSSVIIVATDQTPKGPWPSLPERLLTLQLTDYFPDPDSDIRVAALFNLIALVRPRVFHNINSETAWRLIIRAGDRLRRYCKIFASIFAFQYHPETGAEVGYAASFLRDGLPHLDGLLSDNRRFVRDAIERYSLQKYEGRFFPIYNPCRNFPSAILSVARQRTQAAIQPPAITGKMKILWAGRLDAEKRIDLLAKVGRICPSVEFHVFGSAVVESASLDELRLLENIVLRGPFNDPAKLVQAEHFHAFMFTSRWEGMPNVLIEFGMLGLPIIAPAVGGVSELISEATGYLLTASPSPEEYAAAISTIRAAPAQAGTRAVNLQRLIESRHSFGAFLSAVSAVPNYLTESAER